MPNRIKNLNSVDQLFFLMRILAFIGGLLWVFLSPVIKENLILIYYIFSFFFIYSGLLYFLIYRFPHRISNLYVSVLFLDLIFIFLLVYLTGGYHSDFYLAFFIFIALHSFYFGLKFGVGVAILSSLLYLGSGNFEISSFNFIQLGFRIALFNLIGVSMGLVSKKESLDKKRIQNLNKELELRHIELEQERDKLAKILTGIDAGMVLLNTDFKILWVNKIIENWFKPFEQLKDQTCSNALWETKDICQNCLVQNCFENGAIETFEFDREFSGKQKYYRITAAPLYNEGGKIDRVLELIQDISEEKELQLNFIHTSKLAAVGELASGVAHEINNPLSSIAICVEEIASTLNDNFKDVKISAEVDDCLKSIKNEIQRCKRITTGLLNIGRKSKQRFSQVNLTQLITDVVLLVRHKALKENKKINLNLIDKIPLITGESDQISQVLLNVLLNALDFTPRGKEITISNGMENENTVYLKIIDQGCGIPPRNLDKIFNPFFTTKPSGKGSGLGLAISYRIIEAHGGKIKVESQLDQGTTIIVQLPVDNGNQL